MNTNTNIAFDIKTAYDKIGEKYKALRVEDSKYVLFCGHIFYSFYLSIEQLYATADTLPEIKDLKLKLSYIIHHYDAIGKNNSLGKEDEKKLMMSILPLNQKFNSKRKIYVKQHATIDSLRSDGFDEHTMSEVLKHVAAFWAWAFDYVTPSNIIEIIEQLSEAYQPPQAAAEPQDRGSGPLPTEEQMNLFFTVDIEQLAKIRDARSHLILCIDSSIRMNDSIITNDGKTVTCLEYAVRSILKFYSELMSVDANSKHSNDILNLKDSLEVMVCSFGGVRPEVKIEFTNLVNQEQFFNSLLTLFNEGRGRGATCLASAIELIHRKKAERNDILKEKGISIPFKPQIRFITNGRFLEDASEQTLSLLQSKLFDVECVVIGEHQDDSVRQRIERHFPQRSVYTDDLSKYMVDELIDNLQDHSRTPGGSRKFADGILTQ